MLIGSFCHAVATCLTFGVGLTFAPAVEHQSDRLDPIDAIKIFERSGNFQFLELKNGITARQGLRTELLSGETRVYTKWEMVRGQPRVRVNLKVCVEQTAMNLGRKISDFFVLNCSRRLEPCYCEFYPKFLSVYDENNLIRTEPHLPYRVIYKVGDMLTYTPWVQQIPKTFWKNAFQTYTQYLRESQILRYQEEEFDDQISFY